jgi:hypothetical protein
MSVNQLRNRHAGYRTDAFDFSPKLHVLYTKNVSNVRHDNKIVNTISSMIEPADPASMATRLAAFLFLSAS